MKQKRERGITLLLGMVSLMFVVPMMGLGIDVGFLFSVKSRLQSSVDGAALAAARALNIGQTVDAQAVSAKNMAVNWFGANFPTNYFGVFGTTMNTSSVTVWDDPANPRLRHVTATATTKVDTFFMKWFGVQYTTISAVSDASRRDAVIMMVLDRSGSMGASCADLRASAKLFTGQFAAGRDYIGMVTYSDGTVVHSAPTTDFRTVLGYSNASGSANGAIDNLQCNGGTGSAQGIALAYNELYRKNLPGALNIVMFETDGQPNTLALNFWDSTNNTHGLASGADCTDNNGKTVSGGGFTTVSSRPNWTSGYTMASGSYLSSVPAGMVGGFYANDTNQGAGFILMFKPWQTSATTSNNSIYLSDSTSPNCAFNDSHSDKTDIAWVPTTDVYGDSLYPTTNPYKTVTLSGGKVSLAGTTTTAWNNYRAAVFNATDNAAYRARTNATIPAYFFVVGLGGNSPDGVDYTGLQRIANDPNGDLYNSPTYYDRCAQTSSCLTYANQPQGVFIFSANRTKLTQAFLSVSSQILRLSR